MGVLTGFAVIGVVIAVGYLVGRLGILGDNAQIVLNRFAFFVASPALLLIVMSRTDLSVLFSSYFATSVVAMAVSATIFVIASRLFFREGLARTIIGSTSASYVNSNNIGLPVAVFILGDAGWAAPVLLLQVAILTPLLLAALDIAKEGRVRLVGVLTQPVRNPMVIASLLGVLLSLTGTSLPEVVLAPLELLGGATIPVVLAAFGMSLAGQRVFRPGSGRASIATASVIKILVMPLVALGAGLLFRLPAPELVAAVTMAALPTAQNVYNFAVRYDVGTIVARDVMFITTLGSVPVVLAVAVLVPLVGGG